MFALNELTILVHGPVTAGNLEEVLKSIEMWREAYPGAYLHFAASMIERDVSAIEMQFWQQQHVSELEKRRKLVIDQVSQAVDHFSVADYQAPIAPLKFDDKVNNTNKMIATVKVGLENVSTKFCLRIRSDMMVANILACEEDYKFLAQQAVVPDLFNQQVVVAPFFTLNPFLLERLPYHFSDWLNFGQTADIRKLWDVSPVSEIDARHYQMYPHASHSNVLEREFRSRFTPEQHLVSRIASHNGYKKLDHHNEAGMEIETLEVLRRNFIVLDHQRTGMTNPKYDRVKSMVQTRFQCLTNRDWRIIVADGPAKFSETLAWKKFVVWCYLNLKPKLAWSRLRRTLPMRLLWWIF
ncbi:hypothetical protein E2F50_06665 [Rhizobium deserti]|uniref:WavE lipopolysaccharide synthesis n=1 Tax=Rhizobium deserti TaxID=2547961 RepID=A0A4R5UII2_9HYPH|nr:WavE lipopolysaccharide synthesis family protein [Rhizobium deserti]TDK36606.1 hypothetical protein E2F50_06665 [Rhizobium deserti]